MSTSTNLSPTDVYQSIEGVPEYLNVEYSFDWTSVQIIFMLTYTTPSVFVFFKTVVFYTISKFKIAQTGLRMEIFQSFLLMQFWNILLVIGDFLTFRIPYTRLITSYCAAKTQHSWLDFIPRFYYFGMYTSQMFTVMFCSLRVAILYSVPEKDTKKIVKILPLIITLAGFVFSLPTWFSDTICRQVPKPYPLGSVLIIIISANFLFSFLTTFTIIVLTYFMVRKVRERKEVSNAFRLSVQSSKMERILTKTMFILLVPLILNLLVSICELFNFRFSSYILLLRPLFLDARVHIVTCYFYLTHPVFKKQQIMISHASVLQNSSRLNSKSSK